MLTPPKQRKKSPTGLPTLAMATKVIPMRVEAMKTTRMTWRRALQWNWDSMAVQMVAMAGKSRGCSSRKTTHLSKQGQAVTPMRPGAYDDDDNNNNTHRLLPHYPFNLA